MAFAYTIGDQANYGGNGKIISGTYTSDGGSTGGEIKTGLERVQFIFLQPSSTAVVANQPAVNETMPLEKGDVTIVTTANETGTWAAMGY